MSLHDYQKRVTDLGLRIFPLCGKVPPRGLKWKQDAATACVPGHSYGIVCDLVAVIDADTRAKAEEIYRTRPRTPWMVHTPRGGVHFYYRGSDDLTIGQYDDWDLRAGGNGYVVGPGSTVGGRRYELLGEITLDLPPFDPAWIPATPRPGRPPAPDAPIRNVRRYIRAIRAVSGQRGHDATFRVACLLRDSGLSQANALAELILWNRHCAHPPWTLKELVHKVEDAYAKQT